MPHICILHEIFTETLRNFSWGEWGPRKWSDLFKVTQLVRSRVLKQALFVQWCLAFAVCHSAFPPQRTWDVIRNLQFLQRMVQSGLCSSCLGHVFNPEPIIWSDLVTASSWNSGWNQLLWTTYMKVGDGKLGADMGWRKNKWHREKNREIPIIHRESIFAKAFSPWTDVKPNTNSRVDEET